LANTKLEVVNIGSLCSPNAVRWCPLRMARVSVCQPRSELACGFITYLSPGQTMTFGDTNTVVQEFPMPFENRTGGRPGNPCSQ